jgi:nitrite reductase/ring-hydroxylating ferredoxin subunit
MVGYMSKLKKIYVIILLFGLMTGCNKDKYDVIPDVLVDFYIDLNDPEFFNLTVETGYALISSSTNNLGMYASGYDDNGIIIYHAPGDEFIAYDRTCPHDFKVNSKSTAVDVSGVYAECPLCKSTWALPSFGAPSSGPSDYPLKTYRSSFDGRFIHVFN